MTAQTVFATPIREKKPIETGRFYYVIGPDMAGRPFDQTDLIDQNWARYYSGFCSRLLVMPITASFVDEYPYRDGKRQKEMVAVIVSEHAGKEPLTVWKDGKRIELRNMALPTEWLIRAKPEHNDDGFVAYKVKDCLIVLEEGYEEKCRLAAEKVYNRAIGKPVGT